jgi:serine protease AprX
MKMRLTRGTMYFQFAGILALTFPLACGAVSDSSDASGAASDPSSSQPALVDRNQNGISDGLEEKLDNANASDRFRVVVTFRSKQTDPVAAARAVVGDFPVQRKFRIIPGFAGDLTASQIRTLAAHADVLRVEEDFTVRGQLDSARRDFGVDAARASFGHNGSGIGVCILDTGVDQAHEQFDNKTIAFFDAVNGETAPYDDNGHGTHVSSIAAGDGMGSADAALYSGVAPQAGLHVAKVLAANNTGRESDIIAGIEWCVDQPEVKVLSMSLRGALVSDGRDSLSQAAEAAVDTGKVVVVAAGNTGPAPGTVASPGAAEKAITVGACAEWSRSENEDGVSAGIYIVPFSSRGPISDGNGNPRAYTKPDVCAPGHSVTAAEAGNSTGYVAISGTSMAAPFVAGAIALALQANPSLTSAQAKQLLEATAQDRGEPGKDTDWGAGLIDVTALVASAKGMAGATSFPPHLRIEGSVARNGAKEFSFKVADPAVPIAAMVTIDGSARCVSSVAGGCLTFEWSPDLDAKLLDAVGNVLATSRCAGEPPTPALERGECGVESDTPFLFAPGRQETLRANASGAGEYRIRIAPSRDEANNGKGGSFGLDISNALASDPGVCNGQAPTSGCTVNGVANKTCLGTPADDVIIGTAGADVIVGLTGNDTVNGGAGDDLICGGSGNDTLAGGRGADRLFGEDNDDVLRGGRGADAFDGGAGNDQCFGGLNGSDGAADCETVAGIP